MSYFVPLGFQEITTSVEETTESNTVVLPWCEGVLTVITLVFLWWRSAEASRVRKKVRSSDTKILATPVPVLPRWLGFLGGHTLHANLPKVTCGWSPNNPTHNPSR